MCIRDSACHWFLRAASRLDGGPKLPDPIVSCVLWLLVMVAASSPSSFEEDQHVVLRAMAWQDFEVLLAIRGDRAGVRMYYLDGEIELTSSTRIHEERKKTLARLLETWAMESDVALNGFGSWTLKNEIRETGGAR